MGQFKKFNPSVNKYKKSYKDDLIFQRIILLQEQFECVREKGLINF